MELVESVRFSWRAIRTHKLRSTLTTLGVVIGVAAVITFVTLGASLSAAILGDLSAEQPPNVNVWAGPNESVENGAGGPGFGTQAVFTERDLAELRALEGVTAVIPYGQVRATAITVRNDTVATGAVVATTPSHLAGEEFHAGRNVEPGTRQAVLNPAAAASFGDNANVGDEITITLADGSTRTATIVGILNSSTAIGPMEGFGAGPRVYVPTDPFYDARIESPSRGEPQRVYPTLVVVAEEHEVLPDVQRAVETYLETNSDASELVPDGYAFAARTNEELVEQIQAVLDQLTGFVTGVALISLLVGAIGIANIMLVSVTERTREIGIMKAVGARRRDILQLFLIEAVVLGVVGAALGTALGFLGGYVVTQWLDYPLAVPLEWIPIAVGVGVFVGVVAGLYPAWNAARTDPIDALRYE